MTTVKGFLIIMTLLLAWTLRVYGLDLDGFWYDEVFSQDLVEQSSLDAAYQIIAHDDHPPLYDLGVMYNWAKLGKNEFFQRFPSAVFGLLTLCLVLNLGRAAFNHKVALLGMFLVAISPLHVYYSREARMHTLLALGVAFWIYFLFKAVRTSSNSGRFWLGYAVFGALSVYTHYYAFFTLAAAQGLVLIYLLFRFEAGILNRWILANFGIVLLFSPWLPTFWQQLHGEPVSHLASMSQLRILKIPALFFMRAEVIPMVGKLLVASLIYGLLAAGGAITTWEWRRKRCSAWTPCPNYLSLFGAVLGTFGLAFLFSLYKPVIDTRYFLGVLPLTCLLIAFVLLRMPGRSSGLLLGSAVVAVGLVSSYQVTTRRWRTDYRGVTAHIKQHATPDDTILFLVPEDHPFNTMAFDYYDDGQIPVTRIFDQKHNQAEMRDTLANLPPHDGVWIVQNQRVAALESSYPTHRLIFHKIFHDDMYATRSTLEVAYLDYVGERWNLQSRK